MLLANGLTDDMLLEDAIDVARMLVASGRAIHPSKWVDAFVVQAKEAELEGLF